MIAHFVWGKKAFFAICKKYKSFFAFIQKSCVNACVCVKNFFKRKKPRAYFAFERKLIVNACVCDTKYFKRKNFSEIPALSAKSPAASSIFPAKPPAASPNFPAKSPAALLEKPQGAWYSKRQNINAPQSPASQQSPASARGPQSPASQ